MKLFLRSSIIIYIAKMWFACLIFRVMAHVLSTKFSDWMPLNAIIIVTIYHIVANFHSLYRGFGFVLPHYLGLFVSRRSSFVSRRRRFESRRICVAPFLGLFASRRSCFAPRRELKNAIWTVLILCTKHDDAGGRVGLVVRALAFHQCGPGSISALGVKCGLSLLVLYSAMRGFSLGTPVFPSHQKPTFDLICRK